ncbi:MAG TPA: hypothetical protein VHR47_01570 [Bacillota bacterium]|nr:hypothetical protein [Bacillota bacterium]
MQRWLSWLLVILAIVNYPVLAEGELAPIQPGMRINFAYINAHIEQKQCWSLSVLRGEFPGEVTINWIRPQKDEVNLSGKRIYSKLKESRLFRPVFINGEDQIIVESTAPWLSRVVYQELRQTGSANDFKEGGSSIIGHKIATLKVEERIELPVRVNGTQTFLKALKLNRGIWVWDNPLNPLVLKYDPFGFPLVTGIVGWRVTDIRY